MNERAISLEDAANLAALVVYMAERASIVGMFMNNARSTDSVKIDGVDYEIIVKVKRGD